MLKEKYPKTSRSSSPRLLCRTVTAAASVLHTSEELLKRRCLRVRSDLVWFKRRLLEALLSLQAPGRVTAAESCHFTAAALMQTHVHHLL